MNLEEYQKAVIETAIYPDCGADLGFPYFKNPFYVAFGLIGEAREAEAKFPKIDLKELGDVCWYLAMMCNELGPTLPDIYSLGRERLVHGAVKPDLTLLSAATAVAEPIKKLWRDGASQKHFLAIADALADTLMLVEDAAQQCQTTLEDVLDMNMAKLRDRRHRGVLQGSGDNR